jgi:DNA polymerase-3 subunit epsilon
MQLDLLARLPPELIGDASDRSKCGVRIALRQVPAAVLPESPEDPLRSLEYAVVDVETTGGSPLRGHRITEFAAVRVRGTGEVIEEFSTLVNPLRPIPRFITALTGIDPWMVADAPRFEEVAEQVRRVLAGAVFVAHNAAFDHRFVQLELAGCGHSLLGRTLCTVRLARRTVPEVTHRSLDALSYFFGLENEARHRALGDARVTVAILRRLLDRAEEREVWRWQELERLLRRRPRRPRRRAANPRSMEEA